MGDAAAADGLAETLAERLGPGGVLTDPSDLARFETGWRYGQGRARLACRPRTVDEVVFVVQTANAHGAPMLPAGANTGLVGASVPDDSGAMVVLSLERLDSRIELDAANGSVLVDGGVLLSGLNEELARSGLTFPIDLGADPRIGGMVATNTGGSRLIRYGDVRSRTLGIEVVLPTGEVVSDLSGLRKNNTGLDAKQLFIGTSGAFGIVTAAVLKTARLPRQTAGALVRADSGAAVVDLFTALEGRLPEFISAYEAMSRGAVGAVLTHGSYERDPFGGAPPAYAVLIEVQTALPLETLDLEEALGEALMGALEEDGVQDIDDVIVGDVRDFWHLRHQISECLKDEGPVLGLDVSVPRSRMAEFTTAVTEAVTDRCPRARVCDFGHWGDGGSHLNIVLPEDAAAALKSELQDLAYDICVTRFGGSYSAEHCVGPHNRAAYERYTPDFVRRACAALQRGALGDLRFGTFEL